MDPQQASVTGTEFNWIITLLIYIGGGDPETLARCPKVERDHILLLGLIPLFVFLYQAGIYGLTAHYLFAAAGTFRPDLVFVGIFLAAFFLIQDVYAFNRAGSYAAGAFELGLRVSPAGIAKAVSFAVVRLAEAVGISQLCAIFFALILFAHDIGIPIKNEWLHFNTTRIAAASQPVDAGIRRQTDLVDKQAEVVTQLTAQVSALQQRQVDPYAGNAQIQQAEAELKALLDQKVGADAAEAAAEQFASNELAGIKGSPGNSGKPGRGPRRVAALEQLKNAQDRVKSLATDIGSTRDRIDALRKQLDADGTAKLTAHDQLPVYERSLAEARDKLNTLETDLRERVNGRDAEIQAAVERAPDYVPYDDGLLHRVVVLERIVNSDPKIFLIVLLIELTAVGLEMAGVLAKLTVYIPSSYNALLLHDTNLRIDNIADSLRKRLGDPDADTTNPLESLGPDKSADADDLFGSNSNHPPVNDNDADGEAANDDQPNGQATTGTDGFGVAEAPVQPQKRKRGRPRKHPLPTIVTGANGQEG
jgi:hypothetical protein